MSVTRVVIFLGELLNDQQKEIIFKDLVKGLNSVPNLLIHVQNLLKGITEHTDHVSECIFSYESGDFSISAYYRPSASTVLATLTKCLMLPNKQDICFNIAFIYSGLFAIGSGHWLMPDYVLNPLVLSNQLKEMAINYPKPLDNENQAQTKPMCIHIGFGGLPSGGEWRQLVTQQFSSISGRSVQISVNHNIESSKSKDQPSSQAVASELNDQNYEAFVSSYIMNKLPENYCESLHVPLPICTTQSPTLKVAKPCLYVFPEGSGQASVLALPGYNMLIDAGCAHRPNFWPVACHFERLDSILITHWGVDNLLGLNAILPNMTQSSCPTGNEDLLNIRQSVVCLLTPPPTNLKTLLPTFINGTSHVSAGLISELGLNLPIHISNLIEQCSKQAKSNMLIYSLTRGSKLAMVPKSIFLYQRVGHGSLELFPLTPCDDDAAELRKLNDDWGKVTSASLLTTSVALGKLIGSTAAHKCTIPLLSHTSLSSLIVWRPANEFETILRFLFVSPNAHQTRVLLALESIVSNFVYLRHAKAVSMERKRCEKKVIKRPTQILAKLHQSINEGGFGDSVNSAFGLNKPSQILNRVQNTTRLTGKELPNRHLAPCKYSSKTDKSNDDTVALAPAVVGDEDLQTTLQLEKVSITNNTNGNGSEISKIQIDSSFHEPNGNLDNNGVGDNQDNAMSGLDPQAQWESNNDLEMTNHGSVPIMASDPLSGWGKPQNLPPPLTKINGIKKQKIPATRPSLRPITGSQPALFPPGYSIASGHALGANNVKQPPYDKLKPVYVDVAFIPGGGNSSLVDAEFFKRVRARYYVASEVKPSCHLLEAITIGKESWSGDDVNLNASLVLAYETDDILYWLGSNTGRLSHCHLNVCAVIARSSIKLVNGDSTMTDHPGYRIDF